MYKSVYCVQRAEARADMAAGAPLLSPPLDSGGGGGRFEFVGPTHDPDTQYSGRHGASNAVMTAHALFKGTAEVAAAIYFTDINKELEFDPATDAYIEAVIAEEVAHLGAHPDVKIYKDGRVGGPRGLFIHGLFRRDAEDPVSKGSGGLLLQYVIAWARKEGYHYIALYAANAAVGRRFYYTHGFFFTGGVSNRMRLDLVDGIEKLVFPAPPPRAGGVAASAAAMTFRPLAFDTLSA